ncbi:hypothetical protein [Algoriphagus hitonicola]|uniref:Uncharacterized protein n=1 Tax=Algoriphagus hitonicola TaxID=435880 RepID=A0A1I2UDJ9_9BACT|nr:hypothetical protein SAMN04487988_107185 [Algoriphagus hitonicola]
MRKLTLSLFLSIGLLFSNKFDTYGDVVCNSDQISTTVSCVDVPTWGAGPFEKRICGNQCGWAKTNYLDSSGECEFCQNKEPEIG